MLLTTIWIGLAGALLMFAGGYAAILHPGGFRLRSEEFGRRKDKRYY